jgi:hypothetical protein
VLPTAQDRAVQRSCALLRRTGGCSPGARTKVDPAGGRGHARSLVYRYLGQEHEIILARNANQRKQCIAARISEGGRPSAGGSPFRL